MTPRANDGLDVHRIPAQRLPTIELLPALALAHPMHAFVEVDVTRARRLLREHRERSGVSGSFTAFVIWCLAQAVDEHRRIQAFRRGRKLYVPRTVDVATLVEVDAGGERVPLPWVIRDAARLTYDDIHAQIRARQADGALEEQFRRQSRVLRLLPRPARWLTFRIMARMTRTRIRLGGTAVVTSVGSVGAGRGWGVGGLLGLPVGLTIGGLHVQSVLRDGRLEDREWLCLTISLDHEVVDGAPATRFVRRLCELLEQAGGLEHLPATPGSTLDEPAPQGAAGIAAGHGGNPTAGASAEAPR